MKHVFKNDLDPWISYFSWDKYVKANMQKIITIEQYLLFCIDLNPCQNIASDLYSTLTFLRHRALNRLKGLSYLCTLFTWLTYVCKHEGLLSKSKGKCPDLHLWLHLVNFCFSYLICPERIFWTIQKIRKDI